MKLLAISAIFFYQYFLSPILKQIVGTRNACKQNPTCSAYALNMFRTQPFFPALSKTTLRILSCR